METTVTMSLIEFRRLESAENALKELSLDRNKFAFRNGGFYTDWIVIEGSLNESLIREIHDLKTQLASNRK